MQDTQPRLTPPDPTPDPSAQIEHGITVGILRGKVVVHFGKPTPGFMLTSQDALAFANLLRKTAHAIARGQR